MPTANKCLLLICGILGADTAKLTPQLQPFLVCQLHNEDMYTSDFLLTLFSLIQKVFSIYRFLKRKITVIGQHCHVWNSCTILARMKLLLGVAMREKKFICCLP